MVTRYGITRYLEARKLPEPTGVELFRYNTTSDEFAALHKYLQTHERDAVVWKPRDYGALILLIVDWASFNAKYEGSFWRDCRDALNLEILFNKVRLPEALDEGWRYWKRPSPRPFNVWASVLLLEAGVPQCWPIPQLVSDTLKAMHRKSHIRVEELVRKLERDLESRFHIKGQDGVYGRIFGQLALSVTRYRQELEIRSQIPSSAQTMLEWEASLSFGMKPECRLPIRNTNDAIFTNWIYHFLADPRSCVLPIELSENRGTKLASAQLDKKISDTIPNEASLSIEARAVSQPKVEVDICSPISVKIIWPVEAIEPQVQIAFIGEHLPHGYVASKAPAFADKETVVICCSTDSSLRIRLARTDGGFRGVDGETCWLWPLSKVNGGELAVTRMVRAESAIIPLGIQLPLEDVIAAKKHSSLIASWTLTSNEVYRVWFSEPAELRFGNADQVSPHCFEVRGEAGRPVGFACGADIIEYAFVAQPLVVELVGPRWRSSTALGPYFGAPRIRAATVLPVTVTLPDGRLREYPRATADLQPFDDSEFLNFAGVLSCSIRAGEAEAHIRIRTLPANSKFKLAPPRADGQRALVVESSFLASLKVLQRGSEVPIAEASATNGQCEVFLPSVDTMRKYIIELTFRNSRRVRAPIIDIRRRLWVCDGNERVEVIALPRGRALPLSRNTARLLSVEGAGLLEGDVFSVTVCSFLTGQPLPKIKRLSAIPTDGYTSFGLSLGDVIDDLEHDGHHEIDFAVDELGIKFTWRLRIEDSHFVRSNHAIRRLQLVPFSKLKETLHWRYVLGRRLGDPSQSLPMTAVAIDEWDGTFPEIEGETIFAAPFDGAQRVGRVSAIEGKLVETTSAAVFARADFESGDSKRRELSQIWSNLREFNSPHSFPILRDAIADGALPVYLSFQGELRHDELFLTRAVSADAWRSVFAALDAETGDGVLARLTSSSAPIETLLMYSNYRKSNGMLNRHLFEDLAKLNFNFDQITPALNHGTDVDSLTPVSILDFHTRLAPLLDHWRNGSVSSLRASVLDDVVLEFGTPPAEVLNWLQKYSSESLEIWGAAICLAAAAARVVLDLNLTPANRVRLRSAVISPRQVRAWEICQPLADSLYLFSLLALRRQTSLR